MLKSVQVPPATAGKLIVAPWKYAGVSRSVWTRARRAGHTPLPRRVPGCARPHFVTAEVDAWVSTLPVMMEGGDHATV